MLVWNRRHGREMAVTPSQLIGIDVDEPTVETIAELYYWLAQGSVSESPLSSTLRSPTENSPIFHLPRFVFRNQELAGSATSKQLYSN
jgi:hypothetical protein